MIYYKELFTIIIICAAYQVKSNHYESDAVWFDNSRLKTMDLSSLSADDNVIEIDSDDDDFDDDFGDNEYPSGLTNTADDTGDEKANTCDICHRKVASSYNLKRHMMIHTGDETENCPNVIENDIYFYYHR